MGFFLFNNLICTGNHYKRFLYLYYFWFIQILKDFYKRFICICWSKLHLVIEIICEDLIYFLLSVYKYEICKKSFICIDMN